MPRPKTLIRNQDQFLVRLPDGMRERIKAKADRAGMSMNEAIVHCLDRYFPAPQTFEDRVNELAQMVAMLKDAADENAALDAVINSAHDTIVQIASAKISTAPDFKASVRDHLARWVEEQEEALYEQYQSPFDDPGGDLDDR